MSDSAHARSPRLDRRQRLRRPSAVGLITPIKKIPELELLDWEKSLY
jgi:hypothetical protein